MKEKGNVEKDTLLEIEISFKQDVIFAWDTLGGSVS